MTLNGRTEEVLAQLDLFETSKRELVPQLLTEVKQLVSALQKLGVTISLDMREREKPPRSAYHCSRCGAEGHRKPQCPQLDQYPPKHVPA